MKADALIQKRFEELAKKIRGLYSLVSDDHCNTVVRPELFQEWTTSAASLFERVFGQKSVHFNNFEKHYRDANGSEHDRDKLIGGVRRFIADYL